MKRRNNRRFRRRANRWLHSRRASCRGLSWSSSRLKRWISGWAHSRNFCWRSSWIDRGRDRWNNCWSQGWILTRTGSCWTTRRSDRRRQTRRYNRRFLRRSSCFNFTVRRSIVKRARTVRVIVKVILRCWRNRRRRRCNTWLGRWLS